MISYMKFKELFDHINYESEISFYFKNRKYIYMIIKYSSYVTFQRCGSLEEQSGEVIFSSLDELVNSRTIDDIILLDEWKDIEDIVFDNMYSIVNKEELFKAFEIE